MSSINKVTVERNQRILLDLINKPGNDVCADCKSKGPRWASHNLGIFLCVNCASIHRKIGTHITKVKSITMDSWTKEQVEIMRTIGNVASNAKYNPNESRHSPPANREDSERDTKYESKRFMTKLVDLPARNVDSTSRTSFPPTLSASPQPASKTQSQVPPLTQRSISMTLSPAASHPVSQSSATSVPTNSVWNDLISLSKTPTQPSPLPLTAARLADPYFAAGSSGVAPFQSTPGSNFASAGGSIHTSLHLKQPASHIQQGGIIGYDPTTFVQNSPAFSSSVGSPTDPHSLPYLQQMPLQKPQASVHPMGSQSPAIGFSQPFFQQQGMTTTQGYALAPQGLTPSPGLLQSFQPSLRHDMNNTFYTQWQPTQAEYPFVPEYNQWTS
ncbi:hypothetical protein Clacol_008841 [Clathrus columnatus]|uniref:Arf-GAP domain-containing protein n=1 Tax=Clathrus columnatus TaxID=1419009 RepID=A0AAV5ANV5_9AGAM|nr:hypothetical protein Clacol_008841 [Clathrus columnatus]